MEDDIIMQTIIGKENWNEFAEEITNNTSIKWTSNKRLTEYNPFEDFEYGNIFINENGKLFCLVNLVTLKGTIKSEIGIETISITNIDGYNLISNEEFLNICKENYPKKIHFYTYVLEEEWKNFIDILDTITKGKEFIIGRRRLFGPSVEMNIYNKKQASYFNHFSPFNKIRTNLIGENNMTIEPPSGIFIHYELDGEKEKLYTTKSIDSSTNDIPIDRLEFLSLCSKL